MPLCEIKSKNHRNFARFRYKVACASLPIQDRIFFCEAACARQRDPPVPPRSARMHSSFYSSRGERNPGGFWRAQEVRETRAMRDQGDAPPEQVRRMKMQRGKMCSKNADDQRAGKKIRTGIFAEEDIVRVSSPSDHLPVPTIAKLYDTR